MLSTHKRVYGRGKTEGLPRSSEARAAILTHGCSGPAARGDELASYRRSFRSINRKSLGLPMLGDTTNIRPGREKSIATF
jgi:hypothetical protein